MKINTYLHEFIRRPIYTNISKYTFVYGYRPTALTSQIIRVSSRCSLTKSVWVQQPHTAQKLTILIQNY